MRGFGRGMVGGLVPMLLLFLVAASPVVALDGRGDQAAEKKAAKDGPNVVVITNVEVNVATWIKIQGTEGEGKKAESTATFPKMEPPTSAASQQKPSLAEVFAALGKLPAVRENVVVISNVKVNVATWLDLIGPPKKPHDGPEPKAKPEPKPKP